MTRKKYRLIHVDDYEKFIGAKAVNRIKEKARTLQDFHVSHVNSTYYGGGVAEMLSPLSLLMNSVGIKTGWRVIKGSPDFFSITKKMHNALQGANINLTDMKKQIYEQTIYENVVRQNLDHDFVIIHDPQPLPIIGYSKKNGPWIWRCHIDLSKPDQKIWNYLLPYILKYDAMIISIKEYRKKIRIPQFLFKPAIDPFSIKNREMSDKEIEERLNHYNIPTDLPLVVQVSRYDRWKDPLGVIKTFKTARRKVDATLVLLGNLATDDPEGFEIYQSLMEHREDRIIISDQGDDTALVNALQRRADVVLQKSIREGFGLTVAETMWKGKPVIGGNVGGIRYQIKDGENGFLVSSIQGAAERIIQLIKDEKLGTQMGKRARESVKERFLMTCLLEEYLDLFNSFETVYRIRNDSN